MESVPHLELQCFGELFGLFRVNYIFSPTMLHLNILLKYIVKRNYYYGPVITCIFSSRRGGLEYKKGRGARRLTEGFKISDFGLA